MPPDRKEMSKIFGGWYNGDLHTRSPQEAISRLIEVCKDPNVCLRPLARKLQKILDSGAASNGNDVGNHPMDKNAEEARKLIGAAAWELVMDAVDDGSLNPQKMKDIAYELDRRAGGDLNRRFMVRECSAAE